MSNDTKLAQLRARTDRDLLLCVRRELDRGLTLAQVAATKQSPFYDQAQKTYVLATRLLPKIGGLTPRDRRELEARLKDLQVALELLPCEETRCFASAF
jgi:hypothetical protein